jgi:hypothetical protein
MTSYQEIVNTIELAVSENAYYKAFAHGSIEYIDAAVNRGYPLFFLRPISSVGLTSLDGRERLLTFEWYSLDVPKLSDEDRRVSLSNTEQGLYDIFGWVLDGPAQFDLQIQMVSLVPLLEAFQDKAVGWVATITFTTDAVGISYCEI